MKLAREFSVNLSATPGGREEKELVAGFFSAYQPLSRDERLKLQKEVATMEPMAMREKVTNLTNPFIELGRHEGEVELVLRQLSRRLGAVSPSRKKLIQKLDLPKIEALGESLLDFESTADLARWLKDNA